jgi:hypothetical protein
MRVKVSFSGHVLEVEEGDVLETSHYISKFKLAHSMGLLKQDWIYYPSDGASIFGKVVGDILYICRHRDNGNGYHDVAAYDTKNFQEVGTKYDMDPSHGIHSDTIII